MTQIEITGAMLIGASIVRGTESEFQAVDPSTGGKLEPTFGGGGTVDVDRACELAWAAFDVYRETSLEARAVFLETIADEIMGVGDALVVRTMAETGLPRGRIEIERARTVGQMRLFAETVREGGWIDARIDPAMPDRQPFPRPDLRQRHVGLGPVAVFGASNFPLAFSVAGGDTASALAAGCPVIVKAHSAHPGTSELVGRAIQRAVKACDLPEGVFSMLFDAGFKVGIALVEHPAIKAVGFTGSRGGGTALMQAAATRREPIPVYAEMSSINPMFLMPQALANRAPELARGFVGSLTLGAGQFCTNAGLVFAVEGPGLDAFLSSAALALGESAASTMLTPGINTAYRAGVARLSAVEHVTLACQGLAETGPNQGRAALFVTDAAEFTSNPVLAEEIFGAASLVIVCPDVATMRTIGETLEGQLTATIHMDAADTADARSLLPMLERRVGRILVNGFPTGVEVSHAMVHGGPYPSTSDGRSTSVGTLAIKRFLRPICYQNFPAELLPPALDNGNSFEIWRRHDGVLARG